MQTTASWIKHKVSVVYESDSVLIHLVFASEPLQQSTMLDAVYGVRGNNKWSLESCNNVARLLLSQFYNNACWELVECFELSRTLWLVVSNYGLTTQLLSLTYCVTRAGSTSSSTSGSFSTSSLAASVTELFWLTKHPRTESPRRVRFGVPEKSQLQIRL